MPGKYCERYYCKRCNFYSDDPFALDMCRGCVHYIQDPYVAEANLNTFETSKRSLHLLIDFNIGYDPEAKPATREELLSLAINYLQELEKESDKKDSSITLFKKGDSL